MLSYMAREPSGTIKLKSPRGATEMHNSDLGPWTNSEIKNMLLLKSYFQQHFRVKSTHKVCPDKETINNGEIVLLMTQTKQNRVVSTDFKSTNGTNPITPTIQNCKIRRDF